MLNCRIRPAIAIAPGAPTLNEFVAKRPKLQSMDILKVVLMYDEYCIDNYSDYTIAADQPVLDIWDL